MTAPFPNAPTMTMQAVAFTEFGTPDVLHILDLPLPQPAEHEVVVRVVASPVNPSDTMMRSGLQAALMTQLTPPYVAGMEFAGTVHQLGSKVSGLRLGQPVMGAVNPRRPAGGSHAAYVVVPAASLAPLALSVDLAHAATVPMNGLTARMALEVLALQPGQSLLVTGAAGAVGSYVIQLAKLAGLRVVADAKESDKEWLNGLGVDILVPRAQGMAAAVRQHFPQGVDGMVDCALVGNSAAALVRDGGAAVSLRRSNPITDGRLRTSYVSVLDQMENTTALQTLAELLEQGHLTPRVGRQLPAREASLAHRLVEQGGLRGRVVLTFSN